MKTETQKTIGRFQLKCIGIDGNEKWNTGWINNGTTNDGKSAMAGLIVDFGSVNPFEYLAVGTSTTEFSASQTTLGAEITTGGLARASATKTLVTTDTTNDTFQLEYTWTASTSHSVEEIGYFNASSGGTMGGRALTGTRSIGNGEKLIGIYQVKIS